MKKRILIVEDDLIAFTIGKMLFETMDWEVFHAVSGEEGFDMYTRSHREQIPYDAIYMDLGFPEMSGIDSCRAIRKYESESGLSPVLMIAVTANVDPNITQECLSAGMQGVILKPLTREKLGSFLENS